MNSAKTLRKFDIFISSPSDVSEERQIVIRVIERLNRLQHIATRYVLRPLAYEHVVPAAVGDKPQTTVDRYMLEASNADVFICILWQRMGTPVLHEETGEQFQSGTEYEFMSAYRANQAHGKPSMLLYRGLKPIPPDSDLAQMGRVQAFFKRFEGENADLKGLYKVYETLNAFEEMVFQDLDAVLSKTLFTSDLAGAVLVSSSRHDFYQHIPLPPNFVIRESVLAEVRDALLVDSASKQSIVALHGMGGVGKSVVARMLCDDTDIQKAFSDGILWVTLGQEPVIAAKLREWIAALGGTISEAAPTEDSLKTLLAQLLENRTCLLILDDVWQRKHADIFRIGGLNCRMIITTRDTEIARKIGAKVQPIPPMTLSEAVQLLEDWSNDALADTDPAITTQIADRLGRLPLALKLAGAQLQRKSPSEWLRTFDARKLRSRRPEDVHDSLEQTFGLSLDSLQSNERRLYAALSIFREDEAISEIGIRRLWQAIGDLESEDSSELVDDLAAQALLEVVHTTFPGAIVLHDLLRDFIRAEFGDERELAHLALLSAYRGTQAGADWHTAPDDGYLYDHLVYHLLATQSSTDIKALFADQQWMNVRVAQCDYQYTGYVQDLMHAWSLANESVQTQIDAGQMPSALTDCIRYALICTSINAIAGNHIPSIVARAVEVDLWQPGRALSVATKVPDPQQRVQLLVGLLATEKLTGEQQRDAQKLALSAVASISDPWRRAGTLVTLAPQLSGEFLARGLAVANAIDDPDGRIRALAAFAQQFSEERHDEIITRAMDAVLTLEKRRALAIAVLADQLPADLVRSALESSLRIENEKERIIASSIWKGFVM